MEKVDEERFVNGVRANGGISYFGWTPLLRISSISLQLSLISRIIIRAYEHLRYFDQLERGNLRLA